jgi:hypothetical protein
MEKIMNLKKCILVAVVLVITLTGSLWADGRDEFFKSLGVFFNISLKTDYRTKAEWINLSTGLSSNLFIFDNSDVGYYISPSAGLNFRLKPKIETSSVDEPKSMDLFLGAAFGPGFMLYESKNSTALAGVGINVNLNAHLDEGETFKISTGFGLNGSLEGRMNFSERIGMVGGLSMNYNLAAQKEDRVFMFMPYVGVGF